MGYMHHERCLADRRSVRVGLTDKGRRVRDSVAALFVRHAAAMGEKAVLGIAQDQINAALKRLERFWGDQIRYIY